MFKVHINDGTNQLPDDDIFYIVAKEGIFLKKKLGVMESIAPVKNISILNTVQTMARMHIEKIPAKQFASVMSFFKQVYEEFKSEAVVLLFYTEKTKKYKIIAPQQKVSGAGADYSRGMTLEGMQMIGTIHSHANFSAFHSGTDSEDEKAFDGLHITIGHNADPAVSITASIVSNGYRFVIDPLDYVNGLTLVQDTDEVVKDYHTKIYKYVDGKLVLDEISSKKYATSYRRYDKRYTINLPPEQIKHNPQWMKMVERYTWTGGNWKNSGKTQNGWGPNYSRGYWDDYYSSVYGYPLITTGEQPVAKSVIVNNPNGQKTIPFPSVDSNIPCFTCKHRDLKIMMEEDDDLKPVFFECFKCRTIIKEDDESTAPTICPKCQTDEYLFEVDEDSFPDQYTKTDTPLIVSKEVVEEEHFHKCTTCGNTFSKVRRDATCPFCYTSIYDKEQEIQDQVKADSGEMLNPDLDKANKILMDAKKMDSRIPDPELDSMPLSSRIQATSTMSIKDMMRRVFGRKH